MSSSFNETIESDTVSFRLVSESPSALWIFLFDALIENNLRQLSMIPSATDDVTVIQFIALAVSPDVMTDQFVIGEHVYVRWVQSSHVINP